MCVCGERGEGGIHSIRLGYIIIIIFNATSITAKY